MSPQSRTCSARYRPDRRLLPARRRWPCLRLGGGPLPQYPPLGLLPASAPWPGWRGSTSCSAPTSSGWSSCWSTSGGILVLILFAVLLTREITDIRMSNLSVSLLAAYPRPS